ncbi:hypothetical protein HC024_13215 [Methylococcaceae bacterium WWC4]|nr:hypothetical protein [Methylococcaceae bacterium WWC4]
MSPFKHHSAFSKEKHVQNYLFPHVCFHCRKSFKKPRSKELRLCPQCGATMVELSRKFSAPKTTDAEQWEKVQLLVAHGFVFQSLHELHEDGKRYNVSYPATLQEAKAFVIEHKLRRFKD